MNRLSFQKPDAEQKFDECLPTCSLSFCDVSECLCVFSFIRSFGFINIYIHEMDRNGTQLKLGNITLAFMFSHSPDSVAHSLAGWLHSFVRSLKLPSDSDGDVCFAHCLRCGWCVRSSLLYLLSPSLTCFACV